MDEKPWYKSLGVWAAVAIPFFAVLLPLFGKPELGTVVAQEQAGIVEWLTVLGTLIASALALYGRIRAKTKITS